MRDSRSLVYLIVRTPQPRRFNDRMYTAYCTFFVCGTILAMQIRFIGFNHVQSSEHLAFILTFIGLNVRQCNAK